MAGLPLSNHNYGEALDLSQKRYGQPQKIINRYMKALWELPKAAEKNVKELYDKLELYVRGLCALGKTEDTYSDLIPVVFERLPAGMRTQLNRDHGDSPWPLRQLLDAIYKEIQAEEAMEDSLTYTEPSAATFHVSSRKPNGTSRTHQKQTYFKCCEMVEKQRLCFNCLRNNHVAKG